MISFDTSAVTREFFRRLNDVVEPTVRAGVGNPLPIGGGVVVVETTGRRSGLVRSVPLVATRVGSTLVVSTVRSNSLWLKNIEADERIGLWLGGVRRDARASVQRGPLNTVVIRLDPETETAA